MNSSYPPIADILLKLLGLEPLRADRVKRIMGTNNHTLWLASYAARLVKLAHQDIEKLFGRK
ncbi:hypothetical protein NOVOSPHI9U_40187 [Novosphingobium sp. 9U]|nr:hypothetical protein NOVOSPHI9U_40187 [Novosphingobium sp. 9U]